MSKRPTWFAHTCWFCGLKSKEVDYIVGDGVYQCWFKNRSECEARHEALAAVEFARLPKPFSDRRRDWSPEMRARFAEIDEMIGRTPGS